MSSRLIVSLSLLIAATTSLCAQVLPFHAYTTRDGLPSNNIRALYQDDQNRLWVGTDNGIAIYDGQTWKTLSMVDGLPSNIINDLEPSLTSPGAVWVGTIGGGVARCADGGCSTIVPGIDEADRIVLSLVETDDRRLWISTIGGVKVLEADTIRWLRRNVRTTDGTVLRRSNTDLVLARGDSILRMDVATSVVRGVRVRKGAGLNVLTVLPSGDIWTGGSDSTVYCLRDTSVVWHGKLPDRPAGFVTDPDGSLWISGEYSLMRLSPDAPDALERYMEPNGLPPYITGPVLVDRESSVWIGTWFAGLLKLSSRTYRSVPFGQRISAAVRGPNMRFWAGIEDGLLEATPDKDGRWILQEVDGKLLGCGSAPAPRLVDGRGRLWVTSSTLQELFCYDIASPVPARPRLLRRFNIRQEFPGRMVMGVFEDKKQRIWIGLGEVGVAILDGATLRTKQLIPRQGTVLRDSRVFHDDARGRIWVGDFTGGLSLIVDGDGDSLRYVKTFTTADGLPHNGIRSLAEDPDGRLWIGTRLGGITRFDGERCVTISQKDGLRSNAGWALAVQGRERIWAGTDFGVEGIDATSMKPFPTLREMQGEKILRMEIAHDSLLWAVTSYALHLYDFRGDRPNAIPPPILITSFRVNGRSRPVTGGQSFSFDENSCAIEYVGVSLRDEETVRYEYRLEGTQEGWQSAGAERTVTLAGLQPGGYTFAVRARNGDGTWSAAPAVLTFTITPPFWRTWWFMSAAGLAALGAVVLSCNVVSVHWRVHGGCRRNFPAASSTPRSRSGNGLRRSCMTVSGRVSSSSRTKRSSVPRSRGGGPDIFRIYRKSPRVPLRRCGRSPTICVRISWTNSA
jgi:ligand-binding sensor domain-containing protein